jgi:hypothetical protein
MFLLAIRKSCFRRVKRAALCLALIGTAVVSGRSEIIPPDRRVDWIPGVTVGVEGGIPDRTIIYTNLVQAGADPTGQRDCSDILLKVYQSCPSNRVIFVPEGYYLLNKAINLGVKNGITIRGAGMNRTVFIDGAQTGGYMFNVGAWAPRPAQPIVGGTTKGSTTLQVATTTGVTVGRLIRISSLNRDSNPPVISVNGFQRMMRQFCEVTAVTANTISIWPPLYWDHPLDLEPTYEVNNASTEMIGFEDFTLTHTNQFTGVIGKIGQTWTIAGVKNIWWKNIKSHYSPGVHVGLNVTLYPEIRGCEFREAQGVGSNGGQIIMYGDVCGGLVEDNLFYKGSPSIEVNIACAGNVFAYNYSLESQTPGLIMGLDFDANHGPHAYMNLWEGNVGGLLISDGYFGSSSHNVVFRNWLQASHPTFPGFWRAVDLCRWTTFYSVVGNVLGTSTAKYKAYHWNNTDFSYLSAYMYRHGYPNVGNLGFKGRTPDIAWNYPGDAYRVAKVTVSSINTTNLIGDFSKVTNSGVSLVFQSASSTNVYYPRDGSVRAVTKGTATGITVNRPVTLNSGDSVYRVDATAFQHLQTTDQATHVLHGNYDFFSKDTLWSSAIPDRTLPASMYRGSSPPSWWPSGLAWPPIGPDVPNSVSTIQAAALNLVNVKTLIPAQVRYHASPG